MNLIKYATFDTILFISLGDINYLIVRFMTVSTQLLAPNRNKPL